MGQYVLKNVIDHVTKTTNLLMIFIFILCSLSSSYGAWGGVVVKVLRYYSGGPGIDSRCCHWIFQ